MTHEEFEQARAAFADALRLRLGTLCPGSTHLTYTALGYEIASFTLHREGGPTPETKLPVDLVLAVEALLELHRGVSRERHITLGDP